MSQPAFIQVGALAEGFAPASNVLEPIEDLNGRVLQVMLDDDPRQTRVFSFLAGGLIRAEQGEYPCRVTSIRPGYYLIDFVDPAGGTDGGTDGGTAGRPRTTSIVLDEPLGLCTIVTGSLPGENEARLGAFTRVERGLPLTGVVADIRHGRVVREGARAQAPLHRASDELIGLRNLYDYSASERYEHIYLNAHFYAWHCLSGVEAGLADVDRCHTIGIAEKLYLFVWCEKIVPTLGVIMIDLERMKTDGKVLGYEGSNFGALSNFPVGALAQVLNATRYPR
ncbi:MoaF C-terminal domain-containing protein [Trinickia caryophylli]|uniref:Molybdenum cofactor biosynthesis protein F n=1 Tax=Trinickia caryophylli TaxID=28094 RepID=A0A1X7CIY1_TRICW|nr:MoaF C-terminal domain-containing protein [Trinickia caryophylli]PMS11508.1 molybdenum cofactor biosynthesis protein F [Trinickia caryophylli]TRX19941.1 molybdenum cofactor biosynthesis protein F [Trinickia caryophylli]WQE12722.1 MoaF C-terminal domain-containing protein [Trinickia caryophylli]SME97446.1 Molybdenum cofactor biosynthesis protein F [Trinickia caryophylli]GLU30429.1 molybdenum cofactor biosynthesis protein F [Trinickia caryophylli]